ncbi:hypothetical protein Taro_049174 [Colocasia esculenta]|uniref:Uncharacterized protein n=1 Tax=Colocasia esculenta TaxID=4460 RepID=A0A843XA73_COLES|nr:hypothetical protein [Colocasia esculenta]
MEDKLNSLHQTEGAAFPARASRGLKLREGDKASKFCQVDVVSKYTDGRPLFSPKSLEYKQKPRPNKVPVGAEELVKHMSNIPGYLQRMERGDNFQEKALNFGVLGWQRLEKWTDMHRRVPVNKRVTTSPASSNSSSAFSTFGSSSKSCGSGGSKHVASTDQYLLNFRSNSFSGQDCALVSGEEASRHGMGDHGPQFTWCRSPARSQTCGSAEQCLPVDSSLAQVEENKRNTMDFRSVSHETGHFPCASTLPSRSKGCSSSPFINQKLKTPEFVPDCGEKCGKSAPGCHEPSLSTSINCPQEHCSRPSQLHHGSLDYSWESTQDSQRFSFGSVESAYTTRTEAGRKSFVGSLLYEEFQLSPPSVPRSCPLTSDVCRGKWSDMHVCAPRHGEGCEGPCFLTSCPTKSGDLAVVRSNGRHEKHDKSAIKSHQFFDSETPEDGLWNHVKRVNARGTESLCNNLSHKGLSGMVGCSRTREAVDRRQPKWIPSFDGHSEGKRVNCCRVRHSPLRRLLDPFLKPKEPNQTHTAKSVAASPRQLPCESKLPMQDEALPTCALHSSTKASTESHCNTSLKGFISSKPVSMGNYASVFDGKHEASMKQTLLQLVWKNGLPLLTFSLNESYILAARRKRATPGKEDCECIYTFYLVCETKKKSCGWISQGSKNKRSELISSIVGQMNVSCIRDCKNHFSHRQFVLIGPELRPSAHGTSQPVLDGELAAIVVKVLNEKVESFTGDFPQRRNHRYSSKGELEANKYAFHTTGTAESEQDMEKSAPDIVAILPSEVHGLPDTGEPSPLVDRWKSQGLCDCGGWDVGCSLRILTNDPEDSRSGSLHSCQTTDNAHQVELAIQGCSLENGPVFSLVTFGERLYTVHFHASIAPLQAFAVCIAILHSKKSAGL